jgi:hypothetical protein
MRNTHSILMPVLALVVLAGAWLTYSYRSGRREEMQIRARYQQMRLALSSGDTNVTRSLFAPDNRGGAHHNFGILDTFMKPLGLQSSVRFSSSKAKVCPERVFHYRVIPGGHTIEMIKVDGEWFFTGAVHVD